MLILFLNKILDKFLVNVVIRYEYFSVKYFYFYILLWFEFFKMDYIRLDLGMYVFNYSSCELDVSGFL